MCACVWVVLWCGVCRSGKAGFQGEEEEELSCALPFLHHVNNHSNPTPSTMHGLTRKRHLYWLFASLDRLEACPQTNSFPFLLSPQHPSRLFLRSKHAPRLIPRPPRGGRHHQHHQRPPPPLGALRGEVPGLGQGTILREGEGGKGGREGGRE